MERNTNVEVLDHQGKYLVRRLAWDHDPFHRVTVGVSRDVPPVSNSAMATSGV
jgi:hypothetical protein